MTYPQGDYRWVAILCWIWFSVGCDRPGTAAGSGNGVAVGNTVSATSKPVLPPSLAVVSAARGQIGKTTIYDPAYVRLKYPGGDVPISRGVCTDVVVRAFRDALNLDLQKLVHEDMEKAFSQYPNRWRWGLKKNDSNIDHRRVPNLQRYFQRKGWSIAVTRNAADYLPGDLVTCSVPPRLPHIMIVSDQKNQTGVPLVIHNIGQGTREEDRLFEFPLTGHYRIGSKLSTSSPQLKPKRTP